MWDWLSMLWQTLRKGKLGWDRFGSTGEDSGGDQLEIPFTSPPNGLYHPEDGADDILDRLNDRYYSALHHGYVYWITPKGVFLIDDLDTAESVHHEVPEVGNPGAPTSAAERWVSHGRPEANGAGRSHLESPPESAEGS